MSEAVCVLTQGLTWKDGKGFAGDTVRGEAWSL